jgi:hypothetical protein
MHRFMRMLVVTLLLGGLGAQGLSAQNGPTRNGFWLGLGGGWGSADANCDQCTGTGREGGFSGFLKLGTTLNPQVLIGVEGNGWYKHDSNLDTDATLGTVSAVLYYYPWLNKGFFVRGGVGGAGTRTTGPNPTLEGWGWGATGGLGYDYPAGNLGYLTAEVNFSYGNLGDLTADGVKAATGANFNVIQLALGFTFP